MQTVLDGRYAAGRSVVALGMFDGVHIGHQVLLKKGRALADRCGAPLVACTFMEHPLSLIAPEKCPPMLTTFDERAALMEALGVDVLYAMPFDRSVMDMPPEVYVGDLVRQFHPTDVVCGYNHTFGKKGGGTPALLSALGGALGFVTSVVPRITLRGQEVSSTAIRQRIGQGDVTAARELLGRPYLRQAAVAAHEGGRWELYMMPNGKQDVPRGVYRALCSDAEHTWPALVRVKRAGRAVCRLPHATALHDEMSIRFIANLSVDC